MQINGQEIQLNNVDSFEFIKTIPDNSVKCICVDPPYGVNFSGVTSNTDWDKIDNFEEYIYNFLVEVKRILRDDGTLWLYCARTKIFEIQKAIEKAGLQNNLRNWLTFVRAKGRGSSKQLKSLCEEILHITKTNDYKFDALEYERECVTPYVAKDGNGIEVARGWMLNMENGQRVHWSGLGNACCFTSPFTINKFEPQIHSTQKPVLLNTMLIMMSTDPGDTVYDFFSGSGSSGVASILSGRNWVGCELDKDMYEKSLNWLQNINYDEAAKRIQPRIKYKKDPLPDGKYETDLAKIREIENNNKDNDKDEKSKGLFSKVRSNK